MLLDQRDYRAILREELNLRCQQNPQYSLRAFARDIRLSPSRLSEILNGKQGLSKTVAANVANSLGYTTDESELFCDLVEAQHARSRVKRELAQIRLERFKSPENSKGAVFQTIKRETFRQISDWYHMAIIRLTRIRDFKSDPVWIANALGIGVTAAKSAIDRLLTLGLLVKESNGRLNAASNYETTSSTTPSAAIRQFHKQILEKASSALFTQSIDDRDFSAVTIPIPKNKINLAKQIIRDFRRNFIEQMSSNVEQNERVYCLSVQFFDLTTGLSTEAQEPNRPGLKVLDAKHEGDVPNESN